MRRVLKIATKNRSSALRTESYFLTRAGRANLDEAKKILKRTGRKKPLVAGDEI